MNVEERMTQIFHKFLSRQDHAMWDLTLEDLGNNRIKIRMETNEGYLRGRSVMRVVLNREIDLNEKDYIEKLSQIT